MKISKQKIISAASIVILIGSTFAVNPAFAATSSNGGSLGFFQGLIQFIAQKFGLDQNQVKSAVQDYHNQQSQNMLTNMENREKARLDKLVSQGKITSGEETPILNELAALKSKYLSNLTGQTQQQKMQDFKNLQNDWKTWAQSQGLDPKIIMPFGMGPGFRRGFMMGRRFGNWKNLTPTPTP